MNDGLSVLFLLLLIVGIGNTINPDLRKKRRSKKNSGTKFDNRNIIIYSQIPEIQTENKPQSTNSSVNYKMKYQSKRILTGNEQANYHNLKLAADRKNYVICPKVRLLDIIEPRQNQYRRQALLSKVQSKHVDFVICDQGMNIKAIIELDDRSHLRKDRIERDQFVDSILRDVGYKVIHTWRIQENILDDI